MEIAIKTAIAGAKAGEVPVGALLVKNGEIIASAHNGKEEMKDPTAHAEILAMRRGGVALGDWRLDGCTLFVTTEPCVMCMGAIIQSHISKLVYGATERPMAAWNLRRAWEAIHRQHKIWKSTAASARKPVRD